MPDDPGDAVARWYRTVISGLRARVTELSPAEKAAIPNTDNFLEPFQASVMWVTNPDWQFVVHSNLADRPDARIEIQGPYPFEATIDQLERFVGDPFWDGPLPVDAHDRWPGGPPPSLREALSSVLGNFARTIQFQAFGPSRSPGPGQGQAISPKIWIWLVLGNIADLDPAQYVNTVLERARQNAAQRSHQPTPAPSPPSQEVKFLFSSFSPQVYFGVLPRAHTLREFFGGMQAPPATAVLKRWMIGEISLRLYQYGLMILSTDRVDYALRLFNLVYAIARLNGLPTDPVSSGDLGEVWLDASGENPHRWSARRRMVPLFPVNADELRYTGVKEVEPSHFDRILELVRIASSNSELVDDLNFWLEAESHREHSQHSQALVMGWLVIERRISNLWREYLSSRNVTGRRLKSLTRSPDWTTDHFIEVLVTAGAPIPGSYADLKRIKRARNQLVHTGTIPSPQDVDLASETSTRIVRDRLQALAQSREGDVDR